MKVDQATFAAHGAALLEAAGRLFRGRGLDVSVADISREAGLTHGAFYGHYATKQAIAADACRRSLQDGATKWRARALAAPDRGLEAIIDGYLTATHRDEAADGGCALSAFGMEAARGGGVIAGALDEGTRGLLAVLAEELASRGPSLDAIAVERAAIGILAALTGGLLLARALKPDLTRSAEALVAARHAARQLIPAGPPPPSRSG